MRKLRGSTNPAGLIRFNPSGDMAASDDESLIRIWNLHADQPLFTLQGHRGTILDITFHPNEPRLASVGTDGTLRVWDTQDGAELLKIDMSRTVSSLTSAVAFTTDGSTLLTGDYLGRIWYWYSATSSLGFPDLSAGVTAKESTDKYPIKNE